MSSPRRQPINHNAFGPSDGRPAESLAWVEKEGPITILLASLREPGGATAPDSRRANPRVPACTSDSAGIAGPPGPNHHTTYTNRHFPGRSLGNWRRPEAAAHQGQRHARSERAADIGEILNEPMAIGPPGPLSRRYRSIVPRKRPICRQRVAIDEGNRKRTCEQRGPMPTRGQEHLTATRGETVSVCAGVIQCLTARTSQWCARASRVRRGRGEGCPA